MLGWLRNKWQRDLVTLRERREKAAQKHRDRKILCPRCGYDITGMPDRPCSECGLFIDSRWRQGSFAAGSDFRMVVPVALGALGAYSLAVGMGGWIYTFIRVDSIRFFLATEPAFQIAAVAFATHWISSIGVILIAVMRCRHLVHGPRIYTLRVAILCVSLVVGTAIVAQSVFQTAAASLAN